MVKKIPVTCPMHYGLRPQSKLILEPQILILFFNQNVNQKVKEYHNMTLSIDRNAFLCFEDPSI